VSRYLFVLILSFVAIHAVSAEPARAQSRPTVKVAFVHDHGVATWAQAFRDSLRSEVRRVLSVDYEVQMPAELDRTGDGSPGSVEAVLAAGLQSDADLVIATGPMGTLLASRLASRAIPVIGTWILDPDYQQVEVVDGASGTPNFTFITSGENIATDLGALRRVVDYEHLAVVGDQAYVSSLPDRDRVPAEYGGHRVSPVIGDGTVAGTLAKLPADVDAVYLLPLVSFSEDQIAELLEGFTARQLPVVSLRGEPEVQAGALLGVAPNDWSRRVYRRVALIASRILSGADPARLPVTMVREGVLQLNALTARRIGVSPPFELLIEAVVIEDLLPEGTRSVDLADVMAEAQLNNRDIAAAERAVAAGQEQVGVARSPLLPQIDVGLDAAVVDDDRANFLPTLSEFQFGGGAGLTQIIWSDRAWANYSIEKHLQEARVGEFNRVRLDVGLEAAAAYIGVLRAQTRLQIQRQNLAASRANLERAEVRVSVGDANRSELFRWQSKISSEQTVLVDIAVARRQAIFEVNRVRNLPLEDPVALVDATVDDQFQIVVDERVDEFLDDPTSLDILRDFLVQKALVNSPELQQFDASILAAERAHTAATRSFWSPDIGLVGGIDQVFSRSGAGSDINSPPEPDDTSWQIGAFLTLPLLEGGARLAESGRTTEETYRLQREREAAAQSIEQFVRDSVYDVAASRLAITLLRRAAEAARNNLDLVADTYTQGRVSLVDLIDAQTNALNAELGAADAVNDYLLDLMRVERAMGQFMFFGADEERETWIQELELYASERRR
jgi:outer membrane protein TolC